jgi:hypothetical protein
VLVRQRAQSSKHVEVAFFRSRTHRFPGLHCPSSGEDGEPGEERLLLSVQEPVAPVKGSAQGLVAGSSVARPFHEHGQALREPFK